MLTTAGEARQQAKLTLETKSTLCLTDPKTLGGVWAFTAQGFMFPRWGFEPTKFF